MQAEKPWDIGLAKDADARQFVQPPVRMQIKTQDLYYPAGYRDAGIVTVSLKNCEWFTEADKVIVGCLAEQKNRLLTTENYLDTAVPATAELNKLTDFLASSISKVHNKNQT